MLLLQLLLQASRFFLEADCTPLHLTCCRHAALVALQLRAVELQLSRQSLQQKQLQQQKQGRLLVSQLLQHCGTALQGVLHPFKDAEAFLREGTELPLLLSSLATSDTAASSPQQQQSAATNDAAAVDTIQQQRSSWFRSHLFSLDGSAFKGLSGRDGEERTDPFGNAEAAAAATTTGAAAVAEAVRESEEAAALSVGLCGPYLQFLHLSVSQVLLFVELHPDALVSGLTAQASGEAAETQGQRSTYHGHACRDSHY